MEKKDIHTWLFLIDTASSSRGRVQTVSGYIHDVTLIKQGPKNSFSMQFYNREMSTHRSEFSDPNFIISSKQQITTGKSDLQMLRLEKRLKLMFCKRITKNIIFYTWALKHQCIFFLFQKHYNLVKASPVG